MRFWNKSTPTGTEYILMRRKLQLLPVPLDETVRIEQKAADATISVIQKSNMYRLALRSSDYVAAEYTNCFPTLLLSNLNANFKASVAMKEYPHLGL
jgi:hypothetical protein